MDFRTLVYSTLGEDIVLMMMTSDRFLRAGMFPIHDEGTDFASQAAIAIIHS